MRDPAARPMVAVPVAEVQAWIPWAAAVIDRLTAENARLRQALEPFARRVQAESLAEALGHVSRDDLLRAASALEGDHDPDRQHP